MPQRLFDFNKLVCFSARNCIIYRHNNREETSYNYNEVVKEACAFLNYLKSVGVTENRICIQLPHSPLLCVVLLSLLNGNYSFCPISSQANKNGIIESLDLYRAQFLITKQTSLLNQKDSLKLLGTRKIFGDECYVFEFLHAVGRKRKIRDEIYSIRTSGSTGKAKVVRVTYQCIAPNIIALSDVLEMTQNDVVLLSSSITFDPFIVEYLLALKNGSSLLVTGPSNQINVQTLADVINPKELFGATIVQLTPSRFRLFGLERIQNQVLSANTSIRVLLLGGEPFPLVEEVKTWFLRNDCRTKIYNIYGITEVSCWSSLCEVDLCLDGHVPIGKPIDLETQIRVVNKRNEPVLEGYGIIEIGSSSRKCVIDDEDEEEVNLNSEKVTFRSTEDIGYITNGNIFYKGRAIDMIKRNGCRIHLGRIEKKIRRLNGVQSVCCLFTDKGTRLICFIVRDSSATEQIQEKILVELENFEKPDDIVFVTEIPLTEHGKVSKKRLLCMAKHSADTSASCVFKRFVNNVLGFDLENGSSPRPNGPKRSRITSDLTFIDAGGTSFQALSLSIEMQNILKRSQPNLLQMMLNGTTTISMLLDYINQLEQIPQEHAFSRISKTEKNRNILKISWQFDTGKCVDSKPTCYGENVCVGSHSHLLVTLDAKSGREVSKCILEDRIECQARFIDERTLLIGCYDGHLYKINYLSGQIDWKFSCGGMIKARPLLNGNQVVVGCYSETENLICLNLDKKQELWRTRLGCKGIFASPVSINKRSFLACSLSGHAACVLYDSGEIVWSTKFKSPIFSTPSKLNDHSLIIAEVNGTVHCFNVYSGMEIWIQETSGNIFSSVAVHSEADNTFIFFGNHDHNVYCMELVEGHSQPVISWKTPLDSAVYSTPAVVRLPTGMLSVVACSTKGGVYILDFYTGMILSTTFLSNEIFSSPYVRGNKIYVGCRNNNLVCLELVV